MSSQRTWNALCAGGVTTVFTAALGLLAGCSSPAVRQAGAGWPLQIELAGTNKPSGPAGPTLRLDYGRGASPGSPIGEFMHFVLLISPEPVAVSESAGNTQRTRVTSARRQRGENSFSVSCDFEVTGAGAQRNVFDPANAARRNEKKLREGGVLERTLSYINIEGAGSGLIEVEGAITNGVATVTEVRLQFNAQGRPSPVSIGLIDIRQTGGTNHFENELVARVNLLAFKKSAGRARMAVTVASVKRKDAGDNLWQKLKGNVAGALANMLIKPLAVERAGNDAMLDFGRALALQLPAFTFPPARHLKPAAPAP